MADDVITPVDMGFAEFVAKLISDVFDAIISAKVDQQEKLLELEKIVAQPEELFVNYLLDDDQFINQVDEVLKAYFPDEDPSKIHSVYKGSSYIPGDSNISESPNYFERLGIQLGDGDFQPRAHKLTEQGVLKIYRKAAEPLAILKRSVFLKILEEGLNKLVVDSGTINAKLNFSTTLNNASQNQNSSDNSRSSNVNTVSYSSRLSPAFLNRDTIHLQPNLTANFVTPIQPINKFVGLLKTDLTKQVRLTVKQAGNKPSSDNASANILSEVEIKFRSI